MRRAAAILLSLFLIIYIAFANFRQSYGKAYNRAIPKNSEF